MPRTPAKKSTAKAKGIRAARAKQGVESEAALQDGSGRSTSFELALRVMSEFGGKALELGVQEIADRAGAHKSQVSKILSALAAHGYVVKNPATGLYKVGTQLFVLGSRYLMGNQLAREAVPIVEGLCRETGYSARLAIRAGDSVVYVACAEGQLFFGADRRLGAVLSWHASASGRVLMAFMAREEQERLLDKFGLPALTPATITGREQVLRICAEIRETGFMLARSQTVPGLAAAAAPIFGENLACIGALMIGSPEYDIRPEDEAALVRVLHESARRLSLRMGAPVYPFGNARLASRLHALAPALDAPGSEPPDRVVPGS